MKKLTLTTVLLAFVFSTTINAQEKPKKTKATTEACCKKDKEKDDKKCATETKACCKAKTAEKKS